MSGSILFGVEPLPPGAQPIRRSRVLSAVRFLESVQAVGPRAQYEAAGPTAGWWISWQGLADPLPRGALFSIYIVSERPPRLVQLLSHQPDASWPQAIARACEP
jgi:hypothetical protein